MRIIAFKYRIKDHNSKRHLIKMSQSVNFVWNYCNQTSVEYVNKKDKWLSAFDLFYLTRGCSKDLSLNAQSIQAVAKEYVDKRKQSYKIKLKWRSSKRSLGWIPLNRQSFRVCGDSVLYNKFEFRFWKSRKIEGKIKSGSFNQDAKGNWYINIFCEVEYKQKHKSGGSIGIDMGLKTIATLSNGTTLDRENITTKYASKLAMAQRAGKKKQTRSIHAKIKNVRNDWNHKTTTKLINQFDTIYVGNVSSSKLIKTRMAKSVSDASWADFKSMLAYKAIALGVEYKEVNESYSTVTCSTCFERTGPSGLSALGVREWTCKCGAFHNRDVNAAQNILRFGHESPIKGAACVEMSNLEGGLLTKNI